MKKRIEVDINETWSIEDLFENYEAFLVSLEKLKKLADAFAKEYKDIDSADKLYDSLKAYTEIEGLTSRLDNFASITTEVDTSDADVMKRYVNFADEMSKISADLSFYEAELAKADTKLLEEAKKDHPEYKYYLEKIMNNSKYMLSDQTEAVLASLAPSFEAPYKNYNDMRYGDMEFEDFDYEGERVVLNHNTFEEFLETDPRTDLRREAFK